LKSSRIQTSSQELEPGDRFEISLPPDGRTIALPDSLLELDQPIEQLLGPDDRSLKFRLDESRSSL
jgi:hypothetical protein